ncbi:AI-2E family transporter [Oceanicoccus sagamiensis]|uniref:AI-2E family transporter n=1 Tax=Oceanicoccus sagamiensis TaxID=716816 RepID=A0A1X9NKD5_9GAMM|nr:AI-2E family transporter [Oceanicoccus sagamiensis]ARN75317.1 AI-2E family transporter [Oceanicoccus sagamiensis]
MLKIFRRWLDQIFVEEESIILLLLITISMVVLITMGNMLAPAITSLILAFMMQGLIGQLTARNVPQWAAVTIAFIVFVGTFLTALLVILPLAWNQMANLFNELPGMMSQWQQLMLVLPEKYPSIFTEQQIQEWIVLARSETAKMGQSVLSFSISKIPNVVGILIFIVLVPILVFFFLKDRQVLLNWMGGFLPEQRPMLSKIWHEMNDQVANYVRGKAIEIVIVGLVSYLVFILLGLNYAALLGVLVGFSVVIPFIGAAVVTLPIAMIGFFQWGWGSEFLTLIVVYAVIQALDGNVLVPLLFSEAVNLHPVAIILAVLVFGGFWGLWGVFFAIPLATLIKAVINAWPSASADNSVAQ